MRRWLQRSVRILRAATLLHVSACARPRADNRQCAQARLRADSPLTWLSGARRCYPRGYRGVSGEFHAGSHCLFPTSNGRESGKTVESAARSQPGHILSEHDP